MQSNVAITELFLRIDYSFPPQLIERKRKFSLACTQKSMRFLSQFILKLITTKDITIKF